MPGDPPDRTQKLRDDVLAALDAAWVSDVGYTAPNTEVYPWLWLWDSCFHSLIWADLGDEQRALAELTAALSSIDDAGFDIGIRDGRITAIGKSGLSALQL